MVETYAAPNALSMSGAKLWKYISPLFLARFRRSGLRRSGLGIMELVALAPSVLTRANRVSVEPTQL